MNDPGARSAPTIPVIRPCLPDDAALIDDIAGILSSGQVTNNGPHLRRFEAAVAAALEVSGAAVVGSGTAALEAAAQVLLGSQRGGAVVVPSLTYVATLNPFVNRGMTPLFCEVRPDTWTLDPDHLADLFAHHDDVRAVVPVCQYGVHAEMEVICELAHARGAVVIYDSAHGFGARYQGSAAPDGPDAITWSFHATKVLPAIEGGAVSAAAELVDRVKALRNHGLGTDRLVTEPGFNWKMSEINARVGLASLATHPERRARRRSYQARLLRRADAAPGAPFSPQRCPAHSDTNAQSLALLVRRGSLSRDEVQEAFAQYGVQVGGFFHRPLHQMPAWRGGPPLPVTDDVYDRLITLPLHDEMGEEVLATIEAAIDAVGATIVDAAG